MKRALWEVWHEEGMWKVQCSRAIVGFWSKKVAVQFAAANKALCVKCGQKITDAEFMRDETGDQHICCPAPKGGAR